jgi:hypothetical protein
LHSRLRIFLEDDLPEEALLRRLLGRFWEVYRSSTVAPNRYSLIGHGDLISIRGPVYHADDDDRFDVFGLSGDEDPEFLGKTGILQVIDQGGRVNFYVAVFPEDESGDEEEDEYDEEEEEEGGRSN